MLDSPAKVSTLSDTLAALMLMLDSAAISTAWLTITLVLTVITPKSSIRISISGTRTALTDMALSSTAVKAPMATRNADKLTLEADAAVAAPMAYLTPETAMLDALEAVAAASATRCADADTVLDADTANDASSTTLADTATLLDAETENAPMQMRFADTATVLVAVMVAAARLTP
jgi:hypothetical protein